VSLVERALKKLQESRSVAGVNAGPAATVATAQASAESPSAERAQSAASAERKAPKRLPTRTVMIDKGVLRAMELLPPPEVERQIASQYQHVKRALVANDIGKSGTAIPRGSAIMMASALPGEGKTFCSVNLAFSMAREKDSDVVLIDADVAKPHVTELFGLQSEPGLLDVLADPELDLESVVLPTNIPGLSILPAGKPRENATELLASKRMDEVVEALQSADGHRIALFDSPPLLLSTESRALVPAMGQIVLVVRADITPQRAVDDALDAIGEGRHVSLILNQATDAGSATYYGYGYGSYGNDKAQATQASS
jgi:protein-tyrosine kinase